MTLGSVLLRLLLCIALAFNGVSVAHAGLHLAHGASSAPMQPPASAATEAEGAVPCHGVGQAGDTSPHVPEAADLAGEATTPDCCKGGCQGTCMQHATPAIAMAAFPALVAHDRVRQRGVIAHRSPAVVRLNRPPIG